MTANECKQRMADNMPHIHAARVCASMSCEGAHKHTDACTVSVRACVCACALCVCLRSCMRTRAYVCACACEHPHVCLYVCMYVLVCVWSQHQDEGKNDISDASVLIADPSRHTQTLTKLLQVTHGGGLCPWPHA